MTVAEGPLELVVDAIGRVAAGEPVDLGFLRRRLGQLAALAHPAALRHDGPPRVDGLEPNDPFAPLFVTLAVLEQDGPGAAADRLAGFYPAMASGPLSIKEQL